MPLLSAPSWRWEEKKWPGIHRADHAWGRRAADPPACRCAARLGPARPPPPPPPRQSMHHHSVGVGSTSTQRGGSVDRRPPHRPPPRPIYSLRADATRDGLKAACVSSSPREKKRQGRGKAGAAGTWVGPPLPREEYGSAAAVERGRQRRDRPKCWSPHMSIRPGLPRNEDWCVGRQERQPPPSTPHPPSFRPRAGRPGSSATSAAVANRR